MLNVAKQSSESKLRSEDLARAAEELWVFGREQRLRGFAEVRWAASAFGSVLACKMQEARSRLRIAGMGKGGVWNPDQRPQPSIDPDDCELPNVACELPSSGFTFLLERPQHIPASVDVPLSQGDLISSSNSISTVNVHSFLSSAEYLNAMI